MHEHTWRFFQENISFLASWPIREAKREFSLGEALFFATGENFSFNQCHINGILRFFAGKLIYKSNRKLFSCILLLNVLGKGGLICFILLSFLEQGIKITRLKSEDLLFYFIWLWNRVDFSPIIPRSHYRHTIALIVAPGILIILDQLLEQLLLPLSSLLILFCVNHNVYVLFFFAYCMRRGVAEVH